MANKRIFCVIARIALKYAMSLSRAVWLENVARWQTASSTATGFLKRNTEGNWVMSGRARWLDDYLLLSVVLRGARSRRMVTAAVLQYAEDAAAAAAEVEL